MDSSFFYMQKKLENKVFKPAAVLAFLQNYFKEAATMGSKRKDWHHINVLDKKFQQTRYLSDSVI